MSLMKNLETAKGVFSITLTPFTESGAIDFDSMDRMVEFYENSGATGLAILGILGEALKMTEQEAIGVSKRVLQRSKVPVIVGVSAPGFAAMRNLAREAVQLGAAAVMIAPPSALRTDAQIIGYYSQAVEAIGSDIPFVNQDYPLALSVVMTPMVLRSIVKDHPSCVMLKNEDWPGLEKISTLRSFERDKSMRPLSILTGNGGLFLDFEMERGANGAMTGYAFPEMLVDVVRFIEAGERDRAHDIFDAHLPLLRYEQQQGVGLAVRKYVLKRRGAIASDSQRTPASVLSQTARDEVDYLTKRLARVDRRAEALCR